MIGVMCLGKKMKTLYTDASFDHNSTNRTKENVVRGKICVAGEGFEKVEKVAIGKVPNLQQYINIYELTAIARAIELACAFSAEDNMLAVYSDSKVAVIWAGKGSVNPKVSTLAHENALEYLRQARIKHGGVITFHHVPREHNPAGFLLEKELEREPPHTI